MRNYRKSTGQNFRRRTVIGFQPDCLKLWIFLLKPFKAGWVGTPETINRLIRISDYKKPAVFFTPIPQQLELDRIAVLKLVHKNLSEGLRGKCVRISFILPQNLQEKIVKV